MSTLVNLIRHDAVALVTMEDTPKRNALSLTMHDQLVEVLLALSTDADCRAIVLTGAGGHFCSGADVSSMMSSRTLPTLRARITSFHRLVRVLATHPKPVVAAVEGYAAGAGLSLACLADAVVGSRSAKFLASFAKVGLIPDMGLLSTLPQRIGLAAAKRLMMSAQTVHAEAALRLGLIDELVDEGRAREVAMEQALQLAAQAPLPAAVIKSLYARGLPTLDQALAAEVDNQAALFGTADHLEGVAAFREKREARFAGR